MCPSPSADKWCTLASGCLHTAYCVIQGAAVDSLEATGPIGPGPLAQVPVPQHKGLYGVVAAVGLRQLHHAAPRVALDLHKLQYAPVREHQQRVGQRLLRDGLVQVQQRLKVQSLSNCLLPADQMVLADKQVGQQIVQREQSNPVAVDKGPQKRAQEEVNRSTK
eukprot:NODE_2162_length_973_cov_75.015152_g1775_i0.p1 GENE.NODE_2162_length_973_cov_75.015152_g1775_i0~~NODE_2162_length_973_cov_75.015152_g1775_i0.p1  ORF type:complete len:164 (+),score=13.33 NODE_2162_length_973_cov_75.015152_g1775_i0:141-632(+)